MSPRSGLIGTTQFEAMVVEAAAIMRSCLPEVDVAAIAVEVGVPEAVAQGLFPTSQALRAAVVENAFVRLIDHLSTKTVQAGDGDPVAQFCALCHAFVEWSGTNPTQFHLLNNRIIADHSADGKPERYNRAIRTLAKSLLERAQAEGRLREGIDIQNTLVTVRALTHGLCVLQIHRLGHTWTDDADVAEAMQRTLSAYLDTLFLPKQDTQPIRSEA